MEIETLEKLILEGRKKLMVEGVESVDSFSEQVLNLTVKGSRLKITGTGLKISSFNKDTGNFSCEGKVAEMKFSCKKTPFIKKIFK